MGSGVGEEKGDREEFVGGAHRRKPRVAAAAPWPHQRGSAQSASLPGLPGLWLAALPRRGGRLILVRTAVFSKWWLRRYRICLQCRRPGFDPWVRKIPWRRKGQPAQVFLPGESHGQRSLAGYSQTGCKRAGYILASKTTSATTHSVSLCFPLGPCEGC